MPDHTMRDIQQFLGLRRIAFAGLSRDPKHFSRTLWREFRARGFETVAVNPAITEVDGQPCYPTVKAIQPAVEGVLVLTPSAASAAVVQDCIDAHIPNIWLYRGGPGGSVSVPAIKLAKDHNLLVIAGECPFMFLPNAAWFHSVHRGLRWMTGQLPRA
jgi:predicted CoA-binding protein